MADEDWDPHLKLIEDGGRDDEGCVDRYGSTNRSTPVGNDVDPSETSRCSRCLAVVNSLRIEPVMFLFMFSFILSSTCLTNLLIDKGCRFYYNFPDAVCDNVTGHRNESDTLEVLANDYNLYINLLAPIGAFVVVFLAPWSDKYGRKPLLTLALAGFFVNDIGVALCAFFFESPLYLVVLCNLATQLTGGFVCVMTLILSHASEVTSKDTRSMKYTSIQIAFGLAVTLGALCGGQLFKFYGYLGVFCSMAAGHLAAIVWVILLVPETRGLDARVPACRKLREAFSSQNLSAGLRTCFRERPGSGRAQLWMLMLSSCTVALTYEVYTNIAYVYAHHMYLWDPTEYSEMWTIFSFTEMVIVLTCTPFLIRVLGLGDPLLGIIGTVSIVCKNVFLSVAYQLWLYYLSNVSGSLNGLCSLAIRSLVSKLVPEDELDGSLHFDRDERQELLRRAIRAPETSAILIHVFWL